ncbi:hypothetical protein EYR41_003357 [Orbilia oligospora]|uniref:Uncharacterized protein n=1 Tax=Orbilia oligospora TaxID=2813651 RepID=A0A7C8PV79_ORBOL|nr:hypothetical protein TWF751_010181 [Orbilia oligospora]TGJ71391.1 hypothetical protein EYR41_003357 [Orbilia oligospora]
MLSFDELAGTLRTTKDRVLQGVARSPTGESPPPNNEGGATTPQGAEAEPAPQSSIRGANTHGGSTDESNAPNSAADRRVPSPQNRQQTSSHDSILSPIRKIDLSKGSHGDENAS